MISCPSCGQQLRKEETRPDGFQCPSCNEHLQSGLRGGRVAGVGILVLACLVCYSAGVRGESLFIDGVLLFLPLGAFYHLVTSIYWPKFQMDPRARDDFPHIVLPPPPNQRGEGK